MPELDAPARMTDRLDFADSDESVRFATLREALFHVPEVGGIQPWIVTESGRILRPREVEALRSELAVG